MCFCRQLDTVQTHVHKLQTFQIAITIDNRANAPSYHFLLPETSATRHTSALHVNINDPWQQSRETQQEDSSYDIKICLHVIILQETHLKRLEEITLSPCRTSAIRKSDFTILWLATLQLQLLKRQLPAAILVIQTRCSNVSLIYLRLLLTSHFANSIRIFNLNFHKFIITSLKCTLIATKLIALPPDIMLANGKTTFSHILPTETRIY